LNETLLTKPADSSGYSPGGLGGDGLPVQGALEPSGSYPYQLGTGHSEPATPLS